MKKKTNYKMGHFAEKVALLYLMVKGYKHIAHNHITGKGTGAGEIDLIMYKKKTLVFVEVKKRKNKYVAGEAVTLKNQQRTSKAAEVFLKNHPTYQNAAIRFDVILFGKSLWPHHIKQAWYL